MKSEATMPARNAGLRASLDAAPGRGMTDTARSAPNARADEARTRNASSGSAARPFEDSMTQAMRRTQSRPKEEMREADGGRRPDDGSGATNEMQSGSSEATASDRAEAPPSSAQAAEPAQVAQAASANPGVVDTPNETAAGIAGSMNAAISASTIAKDTLPADPTGAPDAAHGSAESPSIAAQATAGMKAGTAHGTSAPAELDGASAASLAAETQSAGADSSNATSNDSPSRPGADAPIARSTTDFAAQLAQARGVPAAHPAQATVPASPSTSAAHSTLLHRSDVSTSIGDALFPGRFAAEVALLGSAGIERAEIRLQPRELGPVRVELSMSGESTRIAFSAVQPETRQAIEQSLPILKEMLAERGLTLGETSVSDGHAGRGHADPEATPSHATTSDGPAAAGAERPFASDARHTPIRRTLLDIYA